MSMKSLVGIAVALVAAYLLFGGGGENIGAGGGAGLPAEWDSDGGFTIEP